MKVKVGNKTYDAKEVPIMIIFEDYNKEHISQMPKDAYRYCEYPDWMEYKQIEEWMEEE